MVQYIYFVKCPDCEDEPFDFFDEAKDYATSLLSKKPIISQIEVNRNDFGECTDSHDLGTIWSWEDVSGITDDEPAVSVFTKDDFVDYGEDDPEFAALDNSLDFEPVIVDDSSDTFQKSGTPILEEEQVLATNKKGDFMIPASSGFGYTVFSRNNVRIGHIDSETDEDAIRRFNLGDLDEAVAKKPIPAGMTIKDLVEALEENEDEVECGWCNELFDKSECRHEVDLGWLCPQCEAAIKSRGETLTFVEGNHRDCSDGVKALTEDATFNPKSTIELHYDAITAPVVTRVIPATYWDPEEADIEDVTDSFDFAVNAEELATTLWENFLTEEDVASVPGGFDALEDEEAWYSYLAEHLDDLIEKYNKELLDYYEDYAIEAASEKFQDNYDNYEPDYDYDDFD